MTPGLPHHRRRHPAGFTLIEVMLASVMAALILLAVYAVFSQAIKLRDNGTQRMHAYQLRSRASRTIRDDLQNAWVSGGVLASVLEYSPSGSDGLDSAVPGYLKFTTTTGKDTADDLYGDVQEVEYYIAKDDSAVAGATASGNLVRVLTRDLLDSTLQSPGEEEQVLAGVQSFTVSFWDGTTWQTQWDLTGTAAGVAAAATPTPTPATGATGSTAANIPEAIRIDIQQTASSPDGALPPVLEITVPWTAQPFTVSS